MHQEINKLKEGKSAEEVAGRFYSPSSAHFCCFFLKYLFYHTTTFYRQHSWHLTVKRSKAKPNSPKKNTSRKR